MDGGEELWVQLPVVVLHLVLEDVASEVFDLEAVLVFENAQGDAPTFAVLGELVDVLLELLKCSLGL